MAGRREARLKRVLGEAMPNIGRVGRQALRNLWPHIADGDAALFDHLYRHFVDHPYDFLNRPALVARQLRGHLRDAPETRRQIIELLLQAWMLIDLSTLLQRSLPETLETEDYELRLYMWRVLDDASTGLVWKAQELLGDCAVATPYGVMTQPQALAARQKELKDKFANGEEVAVWRIVTSFGNRPQWAPFWSVGSPGFDPSDALALKTYLEEKGIPSDHIQGTRLLCLGKLEPSSRFILRSAEALGGARGGGEEIVTTFDGVTVTKTQELRAFIAELLAPPLSSAVH